MPWHSITFTQPLTQAQILIWITHSFPFIVWLFVVLELVCCLLPSSNRGAEGPRTPDLRFHQPSRCNRQTECWESLEQQPYLLRTNPSCNLTSVVMEGGEKASLFVLSYLLFFGKKARKHPDHLPIFSYTSFYVIQVTVAFPGQCLHSHLPPISACSGLKKHWA